MDQIPGGGQVTLREGLKGCQVVKLNPVGPLAGLRKTAGVGGAESRLQGECRATSWPDTTEMRIMSGNAKEPVNIGVRAQGLSARYTSVRQPR